MRSGRARVGFAKLSSTEGWKRLRDILFVAILIPSLLPLLLLVALVVRVDSPGPILFRQSRIGYRGQPFTLYKFRTMSLGAEGERSYSKTIGDFRNYRFHSSIPDPRLTRSGFLLRKSTLDELPQLINVLRGQMSLVGPRPELPEIVEQYPEEYHLRHEVKPGMTGLAAIMGRSDLTYHDTIEYDLDYVRNDSLLRDFAIMARTIAVVLSGKGAR